MFFVIGPNNLTLINVPDAADWQSKLILRYNAKVGFYTIKTLNIGTPRPATVVVLNIKQFNFTMK